jgi:hypothetical protein
MAASLLFSPAAAATVLVLLALATTSTEAARYSTTKEGGYRSLLQSVAGTCVCAFDFDDTLRILTDQGDQPAYEAPGVIQACVVSHPALANTVA